MFYQKLISLLLLICLNIPLQGMFSPERDTYLVTKKKSPNRSASFLIAARDSLPHQQFFTNTRCDIFDFDLPEITVARINNYILVVAQGGRVPFEKNIQPLVLINPKSDLFGIVPEEIKTDSKNLYLQYATMIAFIKPTDH